MRRTAVSARVGALAGLLAAPAIGHRWLLAGTDAPWRDLGDVDPIRVLSGLLVLLADLGLAVGWLWLALCVLVCATDVLRGSGGHRRSSVLRPTVVRVLVAAVLGGAVSAPAATAAERADTPTPSVAGLRLPDRTVGGLVVLPAASARASAGGSGVHRVVRPGDTLWGIAAEALPRANRTPPVVDRAWRAVYAMNRARVGPDPDVLLPGTDLRLPPDLDHSADQPPTDAAAAPSKTQENRP